MAAVTKRTRATIVTQSSIENAQSFLQALPEKPKEDLSLKEAIQKLKIPLQAALTKGYTYAELATLLKDKGIRISAATLKNYIPTGKRRGKEQGQTPKTRQQAAKQVQLETDATLETPQGLPDLSSSEAPTSPTPSKRRGRATKTETTRSSKATATAATRESPENSAAKTPPRSHSGAAKPPTRSKQTTKSTTSNRTAAVPRSQSSRTRKTGATET